MVHSRLSADSQPPASVDILGVAVHRVEAADVLAQIGDWVACSPRVRLSPGSPATRQICTVNPEYVIDARHNPDFAALLARADLRVPDGVGVLWAARLAGQPLRERVTGSDGIYQICKEAARQKWRVFFLGAAPGVAATTAQRLRARYPNLIVAGALSSGPSPEEWPEIAEWLAATQPHVLFVAFGHPRQDIWIDQHRHELPSTVAIGVGGAFDFVAGVTVRAPRWVQRLGLEWLHRLIREPWRWRRMLKLPTFAGLVLFAWLSGGSRTE